MKIGENEIKFGEDIIKIALDLCPCEAKEICKRVREGNYNPRELNVYLKVEGSDGKNYYYGICPLVLLEFVIRRHPVRNPLFKMANFVRLRYGRSEESIFLAFSFSIIATIFLANNGRMPDFSRKITEN